MKKCETLCAARKELETKVINDYNEYLNLRSMREEQNVIYQPIRARVDMYTPNTSVLSVVKRSIYIAEATSELADVFYKKEATANTEEEYRQVTTTVGYFSAWKREDGGIAFGMSFCRPKDYQVFSKWRGKLLASYERAFAANMASAIKQLFDSQNVYDPFRGDFLDMPVLYRTEMLNNPSHAIIDMTTEPAVIVYSFPKNLYQQYKEFINRCCRYFEHKQLSDYVPKKNKSVVKEIIETCCGKCKKVCRTTKI